jgi:hypothetical protein
LRTVGGADTALSTCLCSGGGGALLRIPFKKSSAVFFSSLSALTSAGAVDGIVLIFFLEGGGGSSFGYYFFCSIIVGCFLLVSLFDATYFMTEGALIAAAVGFPVYLATPIDCFGDLSTSELTRLIRTG